MRWSSSKIYGANTSAQADFGDLDVLFENGPVYWLANALERLGVLLPEGHRQKDILDRWATLFWGSQDGSYVAQGYLNLKLQELRQTYLTQVNFLSQLESTSQDAAYITSQWKEFLSGKA